MEEAKAIYVPLMKTGIWGKFTVLGKAGTDMQVILYFPDVGDVLVVRFVVLCSALWEAKI